MDHTPGQRQWHDIDKFRTFHLGRDGGAEEEFQALIERRIGEQKITPTRTASSCCACSRGTADPLASHDDTTPEHVAEAAA